MDGVNFAAIVIGVLILLYAMGHLHDALIVIMKRLDRIESALELIQIQNMPDDEED